MQTRVFIRRLLTLLAFTSAAGLAACGGEPPRESDPGQLESTEQGAASAYCAGTSATITAGRLIAGDGILFGSGAWTVSGGANGVLIQVWIDGVLRQEELQQGTQGSYGFNEDGIACGSNTLLVKAFPRIINGTTSSTCLNNGASSTYSVTHWCGPSASLSCSLSSETFSCNGSGNGINEPLTPVWRYSWKPNTSSTWQVGEWYDGNWSASFLCKPWSYSARVEFRVRDANGNYSATVTRLCREILEP